MYLNPRAMYCLPFQLLRFIIVAIVCQFNKNECIKYRSTVLDLHSFFMATCSVLSLTECAFFRPVRFARVSSDARNKFLTTYVSNRAIGYHKLRKKRFSKTKSIVDTMNWYLNSR